MAQSRALPYLAFAGCSSIWGSTFLAIRLSNENGLPPLWAATLRLLLAACLLLLVLKIKGERLPGGASRKAAMAYGAFEFGSLALLYWGEMRVPSGLAAMLYASTPVLTILSTRMLGMERLDGRKLAAATVGLLGVAIIFWKELDQGVAPGPLAAVFLAVVAAMCGILVLKSGPPQSALSSNAVGALVGAPICLAGSFSLGESHPLPAAVGQWGPLIYLTLMGSLGAFVLLAWLVNKWHASSVSFIAIVVPVIAIILGGLVLGERLAPGALIGAAVVLAATVTVLRLERQAS